MQLRRGRLRYIGRRDFSVENATGLAESLAHEIAVNPLDPIEQEIAAALTALPVRAEQNRWTADRLWTLELKAALGSIGRAQGFDVCTSGWGLNDEHCWPEWLYDLTWVKMRDDGALIDVPLVAEFEWAGDLESKIEPDFQKMLLARAGRRVMVFQKPTLSEVEKVIARLEAQILAFARTQPGDRYLLFGLDLERHRFTQRHIIA